MRAKILSASAGSGKTYRLAYKFVHDTIKHYEQKPYLYRAILAATFTNKATEEMKRRILNEIHLLSVSPEKSDYIARLHEDIPHLSNQEIMLRAKSILSKILHDYSRFTILTIDKFFQRILRAFIKELGIDLNYNIELENASILAKSTDALIDEIKIDKELEDWIMAFAQENMNEKQSWDIRTSLKKLGEEIFKEQSKQSIINSTPKEQLLEAVNLATKELEKVKAQIASIAQQALGLMEQAGFNPSDFYSGTNSFAHYFEKVKDGDFIAPSQAVRKKSLTTDGWARKGSAAQSLAGELRPMLESLCRIYDDNLKMINSLKLIKTTYRSYALLQDIYRKVREQCEQEEVMLLDETKYILSRFIADNDAPFIYEKTGNRFERFMIDEFQDTSVKEWGNFVPLLQNAMAQSEDTSVLIVGDVKQSIYRWRGGDWRILHQGIGEALGKEDTHTEYMEDNYRSLSEVVEFNNKIIERVVSCGEQILNGFLDEIRSKSLIDEQCYKELYGTLSSAYANHSQRAKIKSEQKGYICARTYQEQPPIIEVIESAIKRGYSYNDILILHRKNPECARTANILLEYKLQHNAQFNIMTQESLVVGKAAICNFVIAVLRLSQHREDMLSRAIMQDYLKRGYDEPLDEQDEALIKDIAQLTPEEAFERIVIGYKLQNRSEEIAYLQALHEQVVSFCSSKVADIELFLRWWDEEGNEENLSVERGENTIELMTIHKAKGLERKVIIIPYCNWDIKPRANSLMWALPDEKEAISAVGRMPVNYMNDMAKSAFSEDFCRETVYSFVDNVNLLYVALTRAREELYIFMPEVVESDGKKSKSDANELAKKIPDKLHKILWQIISNNQEGDMFEWGEKIIVNKKEAKRDNIIENRLLEAYPTSEVKLSLSLPSERYFEQGCDPSVPSAREIGIMMHSILSRAENSEQVAQLIEESFKAGKINAEQREELKEAIRREFSDEQVAEWFSGCWESVRNENDIISGEIVGSRRPDRVMLAGDRAVVVDYKFGSEKLPLHNKQMTLYMQLLRQMGYERVEGYIWYLMMGEKVRVEL